MSPNRMDAALTLFFCSKNQKFYNVVMYDADAPNPTLQALATHNMTFSYAALGASNNSLTTSQHKMYGCPWTL